MSVDIVLDPSQRAAVDLMLSAPIAIVTGGPGCGKTTTLKVALDHLDAQGQDSYLLAAPTGKAARRMHEATGREAVTIHRLLDYGRTETGFGFRRNAEDPIEASLVVIDEASMIDVRLGRALFDAIDWDRTRVIFVGDVNQLPSVGPGRVFGDLIDSEAVPVARLEHVHRSAAESWVCAAAPEVLAGRAPRLAPRPDFMWISVPSAFDVGDAVLEVVSRTLPDRGAGEAQVLVPQRTGAAGTAALNDALQDAMNPGEGGFRRGKQAIRPGDRVIQTVNHYGLGVMNGEVGAVERLEKEAVRVAFDDRTVSYDLLSAQGLELAYALTIHKSQGSEWPWVVVVCHSTHAFMLSRQLLYTAITRAKAGVVIVGDERGLDLALKNVAPARRNTTLAQRLREGKEAA